MPGVHRRAVRLEQGQGQGIFTKASLGRWTEGKTNTKRVCKCKGRAGRRENGRQRRRGEPAWLATTADDARRAATAGRRKQKQYEHCQW